MSAEQGAPGTSILQKMLAVMTDCGYIQKDKENTFHHYWYASEAAIKDRVHKALVEHRVIPQFSLTGLKEREIPKQGKASEWLVTADVHYKFLCVDTGEFIEGTFYGCGVDSSDKGLYKAVTGAIKYILTSQFLIATGDDPEQDEGRTLSKDEKKGKQQEYLASKGIGAPMPPVEKQQSFYQSPAGSKPSSAQIIRELADTLDQPPQVSDIERRQTVKNAEAQAAIKSIDGKKRKRGSISFDALKSWKKLKDELRALTGTDQIYYATLKSKGFDHADEIDSEATARAIFGVLGVERKRLMERDDNLKTLSAASDVIGARAFANCLGTHGAETLDDALALSGDAWQALLAELKDLVDARKASSV